MTEPKQLPFLRDSLGRNDPLHPPLWRANTLLILLLTLTLHMSWSGESPAASAGRALHLLTANQEFWRSTAAIILILTVVWPIPRLLFRPSLPGPLTYIAIILAVTLMTKNSAGSFIPLSSPAASIAALLAILGLALSLIHLATANASLWNSPAQPVAIAPSPYSTNPATHTAPPHRSPDQGQNRNINY